MNTNVPSNNGNIISKIAFLSERNRVEINENTKIAIKKVPAKYADTFYILR